MANEVEIRVTADTKAAERGLKDMRGSIDKFAKRARVAGAALTAIGVGGAVGLKKLIGSYKEQEIGVNKLNQALVNVGHTYGGQEAAIESVIESIQRKTNFGDEEQRESLRTLITIGGTYEGSLEALKVATDMAAGANMSLEGASLLLGKAIAGETSSLSRYGIKLAEGATQTEIMAALTDQFGGMAEAAVDPLTQLGNRAGDVGQSFGQHLSPFVDAAAKVLERLMDKFSKIDPKWQRAIALIAGMTVVFALIAGPLLLFIGMLPLLAGGFHIVSGAAVKMRLALGPHALAIAGIAAAIVIAIAVFKNWDKIMAWLQTQFTKHFSWLLPGGSFETALQTLKDGWNNVWDGIKEKLWDVAQFIVPKVEFVLNAIVDMVNGALEVAQKLGFMKDVAKFDKFELDAEEMAEFVKTTVVNMATATVDAAKGMAHGIKAGVTGVFEEIGETIDGVIGTTGSGIDAIVAVSEEGFGVTIPAAVEKGNKAVEKFGEKTEKAIEKIKTFNELVQAGQFQTRVRGGMPEVMAYGAGGVERRGIPSMDIFAQKDLLLGVARIVNQTARQRSLENTLRLFGGQVIDELKFVVEHIKMEGTFTQKEIEKFANRVKADAAIQARERHQYTEYKRSAIDELFEGDEASGLVGNIPQTAKGGIVTRPTIALLGEAGPEAIIPLRGGGAGMAPTYNITISGNTVFGEMDFKRLVVKAVTDSHRRGGLPFLGRA